MEKCVYLMWHIVSSWKKHQSLEVQLMQMSNNFTHKANTLHKQQTQITTFMGPTWGPPGSCRRQMGPMLATWTLLSGKFSATKIAHSDITAFTFNLYIKAPLIRMYKNVTMRQHSTHINLCFCKSCLFWKKKWLHNGFINEGSTDIQMWNSANHKALLHTIKMMVCSKSLFFNHLNYKSSMETNVQNCYLKRNTYFSKPIFCSRSGPFEGLLSPLALFQDRTWFMYGFGSSASRVWPLYMVMSAHSLGMEKRVEGKTIYIHNRN